MPGDNGPTLLKRVRLTNYKSIASCDVQLGPLTFLVGPNGSGKSNFLDALGFVAKALQTSVATALEIRGGFSKVRRRPASRGDRIAIALEFQASAARQGQYEVEIRQRNDDGYSISREYCRIVQERPRAEFYFEVKDGKIESGSMSLPSTAEPDRLYLVHAAGLKEFRPAYDALSRMSVYNINPATMRRLRATADEDVKNASEILYKDGSNAASILGRLEKRSPETKERIVEYLTRVVPTLAGVRRVTLQEGVEGLEFSMNGGGRKLADFPAASISDGTLRALGVLLALFQVQRGGPGVPLVAIEEPEVALHPAAAGILLSSLVEAAENKQVIVTSHSPDLLDNPALDAASVLAVEAVDGATEIAHLGEAERSVLKDRLYTVGELLRLNQLSPAP